MSASWKGLFDALGLPQAEPALYAQLAGGLLLAFAALLWITPGQPSERSVAGVTAAANALGVVVVGAWLLSGKLHAETLGKVILWLAVVALVAFAAGEARIARGKAA